MILATFIDPKVGQKVAVQRHSRHRCEIITAREVTVVWVGKAQCRTSDGIRWSKITGVRIGKQPLEWLEMILPE